MPIPQVFLPSLFNRLLYHHRDPGVSIAVAKTVGRAITVDSGTGVIVNAAGVTPTVKNKAIAINGIGGISNTFIRPTGTIVVLFPIRLSRIDVRNGIHHVGVLS
jgi:hypothetical protein